jgi:hypothetical protein
LTHRFGKGHHMYNPNKDEFRAYRSLVENFQKFWIKNIKDLPNYEKRGMAGKTGAYHLDHRISVKFGFENKICPSVIGHICNLVFIPWEENYKKRTGCSTDVEILLEEIKQCSI